MNPELYALLADALRDPATGINMLSAQCPQDVDAPPLPPVRVTTCMEEAWVGRSPLPEEPLEDGPVCFLRQADEYVVAGNALEPGAIPDVGVLFAVAMLKSDTHIGLYQVSKLLGTALRSIVKRFNAAGPPGIIVRNDVEISKPSQVLYPLLLPAAETNILLAAAIPTFPVYDPWSLGAHVSTPGS